MSGVVCRSFRPADGVGRKKTRRSSAVEECRSLVARGSGGAHAATATSGNGCVTKPCVPSRLERYAAPPSRTLQRWNLHPACTPTRPSARHQESCTHGRSVFRRQSKIHFRGTLRATPPTHVRPSLLWSLCFGNPGVRRCKGQRARERQPVTQRRKDSRSTRPVSTYGCRTRRARHPLQTPLTRTWIWASHIASNRAQLQPYRSMFVPPRGLGPIACMWVAFWRDHRG